MHEDVNDDSIVMKVTHGSHRFLLTGDMEAAAEKELLAQNLDYVVVAAPTMYHEEIGLKLAEAGVHALIEKPLAKTAEGAWVSERITLNAQAKGLATALRHDVSRSVPYWREVAASATHRRSKPASPGESLR